MAFLTYDEVKARLNKYINKPGRYGAVCVYLIPDWTSTSVSLAGMVLCVCVSNTRLNKYISNFGRYGAVCVYLIPKNLVWKITKFKVTKYAFLILILLKI